jgi:hypothetical protein
MVDPSVAQPPLPLQEFLPLQPLSLLLQPPLPLQSFLPLQACLSLSVSSLCASNTLAAPVVALTLFWLLDDVFIGVVAALAPANSPVIAALSRRAFIDVFFMVFSLSNFVSVRFESLDVAG